MRQQIARPARLPRPVMVVALLAALTGAVLALGPGAALAFAPPDLSSQLSAVGDLLHETLLAAILACH